MLGDMYRYRIGQGFDVHALVEGRDLIIGGVKFDSEKGLLGHSDADVLLHALTDALLGAAALGDIGKLFPDSDRQWHNADSRQLLRLAWEKVREQNYAIANIDATIICQWPKIQPASAAMVQNIAQDLAIPMSCINIKGKTCEGLGFLGRSEGIVAQVVVLLSYCERLCNEN